MTSLFSIISTTLNVLCSIMFMGFLYKFMQVQKKNRATKIIISLDIFFLLNSLLNLLNPYITDTCSEAMIIGAIRNFIAVFCLYWSSAFAIFTHSALKAKSIFPWKCFIVFALIASSLPSSIIPFGIFTESFGMKLHCIAPGQYFLEMNIGETSSKFIYFIINDFINILLPVVANTYCYYQIYKTLNSMQMFQYRNLSHTYGFFWSVVIPLICFMPGVIQDIVVVFADLEIHLIIIIQFISETLQTVWGVLFLWSYWSFYLAESPERRKTSLFLDLSELASDSRTSSRAVLL